MPFRLPLKDMPHQEKLDAMESLWADLVRTPKPLIHPPGTKKSSMSTFENIKKRRSEVELKR